MKNINSFSGISTFVLRVCKKDRTKKKELKKQQRVLRQNDNSESKMSSINDKNIGAIWSKNKSDSLKKVFSNLLFKLDLKEPS